MERVLVEYLANSLWQVPLLAGAAWLLLCIARPEPRAQHWMWLAVLFVAVVLPMCRIQRAHPPNTPIHTKGVTVLAPTTSVAEPYRMNTTEVLRRAVGHWTSLSANIQVIPLKARMMNWLAGLYLVLLAFSVLRFAWRWRSAGRLVKQARELMVGDSVLQTFQRYGKRLGVDLPRLRESEHVLSPVIVGVRKPVLLLPEKFLQHTSDEVEAALCHELAHVRRRDYLMNLLCQAMVLPLAWHPVIWAVQRRIRSTREVACDFIAAEEMRSEIRYAKCLLAVARGMMADGRGHTPALGLFDNNTLEERVMWLTKKKKAMNMRAKVAYMAGGVATIVAVTAVATVLHVTPILAHAQAVGPAVSATQSKPSTPKGVPDNPGYTAIGRGKGASVIAGKGEYIHRWTGLDGEPYVISNHQRQEPTLQERRRIEKEFAQRMVEMVFDQVNSPEFKKQMANINSPEFKKRMALMNAQLEALNSSVVQRQVKDATAMVNSPVFKEQIAKIQDMQLQMRGATAQLDSRVLEQQMAEVQKAVQNGTLQREKAIQILKNAETRLETTQTK